MSTTFTLEIESQPSLTRSTTMAPAYAVDILSDVLRSRAEVKSARLTSEDGLEWLIRRHKSGSIEVMPVIGEPIELTPAMREVVKSWGA